ncbi:MAG: DnaJ domain-containing protein [Desulfotalea sp.]
MNYQKQQSPGCGGCLIIALILILLPGGASFLGSVLSFGLTAVLILIGGFWLFSFWMKRKIVEYQGTRSEQNQRFVWLLVHILVHIAKFDGKISKDEVQTIQRFFQQRLHYDQTQMHLVKELIKEASSSNQTLESLIQEFKGTFGYEPRLILLELIYQVMYTNETVTPEELKIAKEIADYLEISAYNQQTFEAKHRYNRQHGNTGYGAYSNNTSPSQESAYYAVLGLEKGADFATIKKSYRKLSMQYHPDKVSHLGEEFRNVAEEKMKEINAAYGFFKKQQ